MGHLKTAKLRQHPESLESYNGVGNDKRESGISRDHKNFKDWASEVQDLPRIEAPSFNSKENVQST
jgi:hypothetical protein